MTRVARPMTRCLSCGDLIPLGRHWCYDCHDAAQARAALRVPCACGRTRHPDSACAWCGREERDDG